MSCFTMLYQVLIGYHQCVNLYFHLSLCIQTEFSSPNAITQTITDIKRYTSSFFPMCPLRCISLGQIWQLILYCLRGRFEKGQRRPALSLEGRKEDSNSCWRGLIFLKRWKAPDTLTIALVFHLFSALTSVLSWPLTLYSLHFCPVCTRLSPEA